MKMDNIQRLADCWLNMSLLRRVVFSLRHPIVAMHCKCAVEACAKTELEIFRYNESKIIYQSKSRKDLGRDAVGNKYAIYNPLTGEPKHGKYFVLMIDAEDPLERAAVRSALQAYVAEQDKNGRHEYAGNVCEFVGAAR